jgi:hypothetical protein
LPETATGDPPAFPSEEKIMRLDLRHALATAAALAAGLAFTAALAQAASPAAKAAPKAAASDKPPVYKYVAGWPKPLPHKWIYNTVTGVTVDKHGNVWMLQRSEGGAKANYLAEADPPIADCCVHAPSVIEFSPAGDVLQAWGGKGYVPGWPLQEHTILVDSQDHVWVGGNAAGDTFLEFTTDGKLLRDWGHRGPRFDGLAVKMKQNNQETDLLLRGTAAATIDEKAHELILADGYLNKRVMVYDIDTGAFKRGWGAYGKPISQIDDVWAPARKPGEGPRPDFTPSIHCVIQSKEGLLYVCDRNGNRVQVFTKAGKFVREYMIKPETLGNGSVAGLALSADPKQKWMFVTDMMDATIWIVNRESGQIVGHIGQKGTEGGEFGEPHVSAGDPQGDIYVGEIGQWPRLQKFSPVVAKK